ncbi:MAG: alpha-galactosidase, partial [Clostridia bacterium]|nr:alpha-galactosidase [Clostridia bacterium]
GKLRKEKRYPEVFEYLGWCSWDAFHMDVSHEDLLKKAEELKSKDIPVRWFLLDDMWAECHNNNRETMHSREMFRFEADPERFPKGLAGAIADLKNQYGLKIGIWYPTTGYWNGIDPEGPIAKEHGDLLTVSVSVAGRLLPSPQKEKLYQYFDLFNRFFRTCDADFLKVDYQSCILDNYKYLVPVGKMAKNLHEALEATAGAYFDGNLINCMGMANENFWNRPNSLITRISGDFLPEDRKWFVQHLIQCSFNSYTQRSLYTGDWDMWWSDDAQGTKNAVLRAMSGGPVYVSDELDRSVKDKIMPIVYRDGRIIRLQESAMPAPDCLLADCEHNGKIFKVFNRTENGGILAAFNIDEEENSVSGEISVRDVHGMQDCRCALVDYFSKSVTILEPGEKVALTLENYDDFRLYYLIELRDGITPVGLGEKYMAPATFQMISDHQCIVAEGGTFCFVARNTPDTIRANGEKCTAEKIGDGLISVSLPANEKKILLEWGTER